MKKQILFLIFLPLQLYSQSNPVPCEDALPADGAVYVNEFHLGCVDADDQLTWKAKDASGDVLTGLFSSSPNENGKADISTPVTSITLNISEYGLNSSPFFVQAVVENTTDGTPGVIGASVTASSSTSITFDLSGQTDSANYDLIWEINRRGRQNQKTDLGNAVSTITIDITSFGYSTTPPFIQGFVENITDPTPGVIGASVTASSSTSITFDLSGQTDSANYDLIWEINHGGRQNGKTDIGSGVATIAINITSFGLSSAPFFVQAVVENTTDGTPGVIIASLEAATSTTLTFDLSGQTDSANYDIVWEFFPYFLN